MTEEVSGTSVYGRAFFQAQAPTSRESAQVIVPFMLELLRPASAIDVGCGTGAWLAALSEAGVTDVVGIDGDYVDRSLLEIPREQFLAHDLRLPLAVDRRYDLVLSLEVAEHLPPECADAFVHSLTSLGSAVLFSAAIPNQGGDDHINEQWPSYWQSLFEERGYTCLDLIRPRFWEDGRVEWWYRQNMFLYVNDKFLQDNIRLSEGLSATLGSVPQSIIHPGLLETMAQRLAVASRPRSLLDCARSSLPPSLKTILRAGREFLRRRFPGMT